MFICNKDVLRNKTLLTQDNQFDVLYTRKRRGREPRKRKEIIGSAKNLPIRAAKPMLRVADVFASRLDPQLTACDLHNYLVGKLHIEVDVELVKVTEYLSSFHVYSQCSQPNVFMSADLWPEGAYVRWWGKPPGNPKMAVLLQQKK